MKKSTVRTKVSSLPTKVSSLPTKVSSLPAKLTPATDQQRQTDERYNVHMNGGSNAPPWQTTNAQNATMFAVPTPLRENNEIVIKGNMTDGMLDIGLRPDGNHYNIVCQVNVVFPENGQPHDQLIVSNVQNGTNNTFGEYNATDYFNDTNFDIHFQLLPGAIRISLGESYLETIPLQHNINDIRYISVRGEVKELSFMFNKY